MTIFLNGTAIACDVRVAANAAPGIGDGAIPVNQKGIQHGFVGIRGTETG
jgi:hypothetical protein